MCKAEQELCKEAARKAAILGEKRGEKRGKKRGEERGILAYVGRLTRLGISKENILEALAEDFHLSHRKALAYLR